MKKPPKSADQVRAESDYIEYTTKNVKKIVGSRPEHQIEHAKLAVFGKAEYVISG